MDVILLCKLYLEYDLAAAPHNDTVEYVFNW
jgi:hypothetical protein